MNRPCAFPDCPNNYTGKTGGGLCNSHYWQKFKGRDLTPLSYRRNQCVPWLEAHVGHVGEDCLIWPFQHLQDSGMAAVKYKGRQSVASRVMCEMAHGEPPTPDHEAAHSCGKGHLGCINPKHLRWATHTENLADQLTHGTRLRGERQHQAFLTDRIVLQIREIAGVFANSIIAAEFGLKRQHVGKIVRREIWRHI